MQGCIESLNIYDDIIIFERPRQAWHETGKCFKMFSAETIASECKKKEVRHWF